MLYEVITNGIEEAAEQCDDGNTTSGDCCSATCQLESIGSPCASDGNACTADACDGAGACTHDPITCSDGDPCTTDDCNTSSSYNFV